MRHSSPPAPSVFAVKPNASKRADKSHSLPRGWASGPYSPDPAPPRVSPPRPASARPAPPPADRGADSATAALASPHGSRRCRCVDPRRVIVALRGGGAGREVGGEKQEEEPRSHAWTRESERGSERGEKRSGERDPRADRRGPADLSSSGFLLMERTPRRVSNECGRGRGERLGLAGAAGRARENNDDHEPGKRFVRMPRATCTVLRGRCRFDSVAQHRG
ncbi:unnamed protein product [Lampetra fluviatilis]